MHPAGCSQKIKFGMHLIHCMEPTFLVTRHWKICNNSQFIFRPGKLDSELNQTPLAIPEPDK